MIEIELPETPYQRYVLREAAERGAGPEPETLDGWVDISNPPAVLTLDESHLREDDELRDFLRAEVSQYRYDLVRFGCSFEPADDQPFEKARLSLELSDRDGGSDPIAWSVEPTVGFESVKVTHRVQLGAKLQLLSAGTDVSKTADRKDYFLRAFGVQSPRPYWRLSRTDYTDIVGHYTFKAIIRSVAQNSTRGRIKLDATVRKRRFLLASGLERLAHEPVVEFQTGTR